MAKYKVYFTVKDNYGKTKEIEGGTIDLDVGFTDLDQREIDYLEEALPLEDYIKRENLETELDAYATDKEVTHVVTNNNALKYSDFQLKD